MCDPPAFVLRFRPTHVELSEPRLFPTAGGREGLDGPSGGRNADHSVRDTAGQRRAFRATRRQVDRRSDGWAGEELSVLHSIELAAMVHVVPGEKLLDDAD